MINDPTSEVTRGRDNWLVDAFSDADAYLKAVPYRKPVMINNLFDGNDDRDVTPDSHMDEKKTQKKERQAAIELLEERPYEGSA